MFVFSLFPELFYSSWCAHSVAAVEVNWEVFAEEDLGEFDELSDDEELDEKAVAEDLSEKK
jgi:hypothetical protein